MHIDGDVLRQCWFLAGPTACGKTAVSLLFAERIGAEIVALDSMSLYRGMDIGTAKATPEERRRVPHHLLDAIDPHEEFSVAQYVESAAAICRTIVENGHIPLFVGGTGLYLRGILRGVFEGPPADWELRRRLESKYSEPDTLHQRLAVVDPVAANRLHPNDRRRMIRALEIHELTGRPASERQQQHPLPQNERPTNVFWLSPPRDWLYTRIDARVHQMIAAGLIEEVSGLQRQTPPLSRTAHQALGYREIINHLNGDCTLAEAIEQIQTNTRQFAKRQHTWFRNLEECRPLEITGTESAEQIVERLLKAADDPARRPSA